MSRPGSIVIRGSNPYHQPARHPRGDGGLDEWFALGLLKDLLFRDVLLHCGPNVLLFFHPLLISLYPQIILQYQPGCPSTILAADGLGERDTPIYAKIMGSNYWNTRPPSVATIRNRSSCVEKCQDERTTAATQWISHGINGPPSLAHEWDGCKGNG